MRILYLGHKYELSDIRGLGNQLLQFQQDSPHPIVNGTSCQEVLRALIHRVQYLNEELPWCRNGEIIQHLRLALALFEARALERKAEKGVEIERMTIGFDGHLRLERADIECNLEDDSA